MLCYVLVITFLMLLMYNLLPSLEHSLMLCYSNKMHARRSKSSINLIKCNYVNKLYVFVSSKFTCTPLTGKHTCKEESNLKILTSL